MVSNRTLRMSLHGLRTVSNSTPGHTWPEMINRLYSSDLPDVTVPLEYDYDSNVQQSIISTCQSSLFDNPLGIYDCAALAVSALLIQKYNYTLDPASATEANNFLKFGDLASFDGLGTLQRILSCVDASEPSGMTAHGRLPETEFGTWALNSTSYYHFHEIEESLNDTLDYLKPLCSQVRSPEADIAGPGVTVSYIIQIGLLVWFFILSLLIPQDSIYSMPVKALAALGRFRRGNEQQHCSTTVYVMERLRASRFAVALYSSIIDFQEAQAFFTLAVQLATIVMFMTDQVPVIRIDWRAARIYSAGNTLVVLLMQSEIQRKGMRWWYMFFLTFAVGVLGMVIRNLGSEAPITLGAIAKCGNRSRNIMQTCYNNGSSAFRDAFRDEDRGGSDYFISFLFSTVVLSIDQLGHIPRLRRSLQSKLEYWPGRLPLFISLLRFGSVIWGATWFVSNVLLASLLMRNATAILNEMGGLVWDRDKWTFGQIIAVLPWAPVISKYLYCSIWNFGSAEMTDIDRIVGIIHGVGSRIDDHYEVVLSERCLLRELSRLSEYEGEFQTTDYDNLPNVEGGRGDGKGPDRDSEEWSHVSLDSGENSVESPGSSTQRLLMPSPCWSPTKYVHTLRRELSVRQFNIQ
ncbi:hypothetical protein GCG54_00011258 [Colletotrichum gloeosporioides]|uniref:Uncharacterized protein n=1 Tax=Colletotrichum gloeosporioides TaxID=474922 RepID=A0A8H4CSD4_COLGL|nr:uncharacterized protein GCG54_00011258 [Colletotrichum gloeosporioides]KAF3809062.1 hypothetical protein GCG54_00011258 [Colletotrichum gloeosporioides]